MMRSVDASSRPDLPAAVFPAPAPDGQEDCICFLLRSAARRASGYYSEYLGRVGLGLPQHALLGMASAFEKRNGRPASITELAHALDLDRTTLSRNIQPLLQSGHLVVEKGPRGRAKAVRATREGRAAYRAGVALWRQAQDELRQRLGESYPALIEGLTQAIASLPSMADPETEAPAIA